MKIYDKNRFMVEPFSLVIMAAIFAIPFIFGSIAADKDGRPGYDGAREMAKERQATEDHIKNRIVDINAK